MLRVEGESAECRDELAQVVGCKCGPQGVYNDWGQDGHCLNLYMMRIWIRIEKIFDVELSIYLTLYLVLLSLA